MTLAQIRQQYGVDARRGRPVLYRGQPGVITGQPRDGSAHLYVRLAMPTTKGWERIVVHPTWEMAYPVQVERLVVHPMDEGSPVVRGTTDVTAAWQAVLRHLVAEGYYTEEEIAAGDYQPRRVLRAGWFRWTPCSPRSCYDGGGHRAHLTYADGRGPGCWQGVYFGD